MTGQPEQPTPEMNRSMPNSVVIPVLTYPDVREAVEWLCRAFGFVERLRIAEHRAQLTFGEGAVIVTGGPGLGLANESDSPPTASTHSIMVRIADADSHFQHVSQHDVEIVNLPADYPYGERQYTVRDPGGHLWTFSQTIEDVDPASWGGILYE